jgi:hypothetical protein
MGLLRLLHPPDRFSNPFEGFSVPVWAKAVWNPILNDKRNPHAICTKVWYPPGCFAQEKGLKFQIELGVKTKAFWNQSM